MMARMTTVQCHCGEFFEARTADVARGWGKFCSKSCAMVGNVRAAQASGLDPVKRATRDMLPLIERAQERGRIQMAECSECGDDRNVGQDGLCDHCSYLNEPQQGWDDHK